MMVPVGNQLPRLDLDSELVSLGPIRASLQEGSFTPAPWLHESLASGTATAETFASDEAKLFLNAYCSLLVDRAWPTFSALVSEGVYRLNAEHEGQIALRRLPGEVVGAYSADEMLSALLHSNVSAMTYAVYQELNRTEPPPISHTPEKNIEYFGLYSALTRLGAKHKVFQYDLPPELGIETIFLARNQMLVHSIVWTVPRVIDNLSGHQGLALTNKKHRDSMERTLRVCFGAYLKPHMLVMREINNRMLQADQNGGLELTPDAFEAHTNGGTFFVFPSSDVIGTVNELFRGSELSVRTGCPVLWSEVTDETGAPKSFTPVFIQKIMELLDAYYYPKRQQSLGQLAVEATL